MNRPNQTPPRPSHLPTPTSPLPTPNSPLPTPNSQLPWSDRRETAKQIRRFLVIGVLSVLVDYAVYTLLTNLGLIPSVSKGVSYVSGMVVGFIGNKLWTFESARRSAAEPVIYIVLYTITLGVNVLVNSVGLLVLHDWLAVESAKGLAFLAATGVTTVLNFIGMKWVTFRVGVRQRRERVERETELSEPAQ